MGKNKAMAFKGLVKKKTQVILLLVFFLNLPFLEAFALESQPIIFTKSNTSNTIGYMPNKQGIFVISMTTGVSSVYFDILDKNGNVVKGGVYQTDLPLNENLYPLTIKVNASTIVDDNFMVRSYIEYSDIDNTGAILDGLDTLGNKLDSIKDKIQGVLDKLYELNDFLSNPAYLQSGIDNLENSINNIKTPISDTQHSQEALSGLGTNLSGGEFSFKVPLTIGGQTYNAFDLSAFSSQLNVINSIMISILWIEFAVFCIRIVVPKFKV